MVTGVPPWNGLNSDENSLKVSIRDAKNIPPLPQVSNALVNFLKRCLSINPQERSSPNELLLDPFLQKSENEKAEV